MKEFNVINYDFNRKVFKPYDIMPHLENVYHKLVEKQWKKVPETYLEFREFVKDESMYQWWSRAEYEIILESWPNQDHEEKWDIHKQVMMNIDIITQILMDNLKEHGIL